MEAQSTPTMIKWTTPTSITKLLKKESSTN